MDDPGVKPIMDEEPRQNDRQLLLSCLRGDGAAWEALIARYQRLIYSIPIKMGLSPNDAADIFQTVCLRLLEKLSSLRNQERISSWLTVTTTRECWRVAARRRREPGALTYASGDDAEVVIDVASDAPLADAEQEALERQQILREAIAALPSRCQELVTFLFYSGDGMSYAEIARRMDMPLASMGPTRGRCLARLKKLLDGKI